MISTREPMDYLEMEAPETFGRRMTLRYAGTLLLLALVVAAGYIVFERARAVTHATDAALALTQEQRMLSQRMTSLAAQLALGDTGVRADLRAAAGRFEQLEAHVVAGDSQLGFGPVVSDAALRTVYFSGALPLDALATEFVARARRIAAMSPDDPALGAQTAPLFMLAGRPLLDKLDAAAQLRGGAGGARLDLLSAVNAALGLTALGGLLAIGLGLFRPMARRIVELMREAQALARNATIDPATGMLNRRSFHARGAIEVQKARRYGRPLSVLLIDADQLPSIEDEFGPDGGMTVLKALTSSVFAGTRVSDLVARVDDEQFAILLPETNRDGAVLLAERLREQISSLTVPIANELVSCTVSIGVAAAEKDASFLWPTFKRADEALYEAKMRGRNRVVAAAA